MVKKDGNFPFLINDKQLIAGGEWVNLSTSAASAHFGSDLLRQAIIPPFDVCLLDFELSFTVYRASGIWTYVAQHKCSISLQDKNLTCCAHTASFSSNAAKHLKPWHYC